MLLPPAFRSAEVTDRQDDVTEPHDVRRRRSHPLDGADPSALLRVIPRDARCLDRDGRARLFGDDGDGDIVRVRQSKGVTAAGRVHFRDGRARSPGQPFEVRDRIGFEREPEKSRRPESRAVKERRRPRALHVQDLVVASIRDDHAEVFEERPHRRQVRGCEIDVRDVAYLDAVHRVPPLPPASSRR
jgi:hypothetical protein